MTSNKSEELFLEGRLIDFEIRLAQNSEVKTKELKHRLVYMRVKRMMIEKYEKTVQREVLLNRVGTLNCIGPKATISASTVEV